MTLKGKKFCILRQILLNWLLHLNLKEGLVKCATVFVKSEVMLINSKYILNFDRICLTPNFQIEDTCLQELMSSQIETLLLSKEVLCRDCIGLEWTCQKVQNSCSFSSRLVRTKKVIAITVCVKFWVTKLPSIYKIQQYTIKFLYKINN